MRWLSLLCSRRSKNSIRNNFESSKSQNQPDHSEKETEDFLPLPQTSEDNSSSNRNASEAAKMTLQKQSYTDAHNIILNHDFSEGLHMWHANCCQAYVTSRDSGVLDGIKANSGEQYAVVTKRTDTWQGLEQDITGSVSSGVTYTVSAFVRVHGDSKTTSTVQATLKLEYPHSPTSYLFIRRISVSKDCWEKLEGSFTLASMPQRIIFYLKGPSPGVDLLIDSVSISCRHPKEASTSQTVGDGNIVNNALFENGLNNWSGRGCKILLQHMTGEDAKSGLFCGEMFVRATNRTQSWNGVQQDITGRVQRKIPYEVDAVIRIAGKCDTADVRATLWIQSPNGREQYVGVGSLQASNREWLQLHGKFLLNGFASKVVIYFEGPPPGIDILVHNVVVKHAKKRPPSVPLVFEIAHCGVNIIENSTFKDGMKHWSPLGSCTLSIHNGSPQIFPPIAMASLGDTRPLSGRYILATRRTETWMGPSQVVTNKIKTHLTYQVAAWVRVGLGAKGPQNINLAFNVDDRWINGGQVEVDDDRWYELSGSFRIEKEPSKVVAYVQGPLPGVDLMVSGLHIFPVDRKARFEYLKNQTEKVRKRDVILKLPENFIGLQLKVDQTQNSFPFGCCLNKTNIENEEFIDFFVKNFNWAVFGNELKWYHTEPVRGQLNYHDADEMLEFCERHGLETRGHCIFWEVEDTVQPWVRALNERNLMSAIENRISSLLSRYRGKFRHYDVNNEMLHGSFYRDKLGKDIRAYMFKRSYQLDPSAILFVNDYHVEDGCDTKSSPEKYIDHILDLQEQGAPVQGIGIQGHIDHPVGPIVRSALDKLAVLGLPIWFTELDVCAINEHVRAEDLEVMLREAYAHPAVEGIVLWGFLEMFMCRDNSHLVDADGEVNVAGKRLLSLRQEWLSHADGNLDPNGEFKFKGYEGKYTIEIETPQKFTRSFVVSKGEDPLVLRIS